MTCVPFQSGDGKLYGHFCEDSVFQVALRGKKWCFAYSPYFGPTLLTKNGEPSKRQPGPRSNFWKAFDRWEKRRAKQHPED